jgi:DNA-binding GntR family transcriptional regulator
MIAQDTKKNPVRDFAVPVSLARSTIEYLEKMIISGKAQAGDRLLPDEIAEAIKVSKSTIREALLNLQKDGFVTYIPRRGFFVSKISIEDIDEIYPIREALLCLSTEIIIAKGEYEPHFIDKLRRYLHKMEESVAKKDIYAYYRSNMNFYDYLSEHCTNGRLVALMRQFGKLVQRFRYLSMTAPGRIERSLKLNQALFESIKNRDSFSAIQLIEEIMRDGRAALRTLLAEEKTSA